MKTFDVSAHGAEVLSKEEMNATTGGSFRSVVAKAVVVMVSIELLPTYIASAFGAGFSDGANGK